MTSAELKPSPTPDLEKSSFPSFDSLRAAHSDLLKQHRQIGDSPEMGKAVQAFILKAQATGALIDNENERMAAQSLLDYWATHLFRMNVESPETTLADFDSSLAPDIPDSLCPYRGLNAFGEDDAGVFFGRQRLIKTLVSHLEKSRLLCVVGPSGSGKSSVVRAGVIPSLKNGGLEGSQAWTFLPTMVPGSKPLLNLARLIFHQSSTEKPDEAEQNKAFTDDPGHLLNLVKQYFTTPVVIVVDQFEEAFTLCTDDSLRKAFVDNLVNLTKAPDVRHTVILTMRTDFENKVSLLPEFQPLFEQNLERVMSLNASELRIAIEEPAKKIGLKFEEGVVEALISDILGEPAALPLLQFTLLRLWEMRDHNRITWESFRRLGGARQALAKSADDFYNNLIPEEQTTARRLILRLVRPGEGLEITSNRVLRCDLYQKAEAIDRIERVLDKFVKARLLRLTKGEDECDDQVEVAHEALVRNWPTLVNWLEEERINIRERQRLTTASERWQSLNRDPSALLRGVLLEEAQRYDDLNSLETTFIKASEDALQAEKNAEEAVRQRELTDARRIAEESEARRKAEEERRIIEEARASEAEHANRQLNRRNRIITAIGIVALAAAVIAIIASGFAVSNARVAENAKVNAEIDRNRAIAANTQLAGQNATIVVGATKVASASTQENIQRATAEAAKATATQQQAVIIAATQTVVVQATEQAQTILYAQQQSVLANTRLGDQAISVATSQPDLGLLLAAEAITGTVNFESQGKLLDTLRAQPRLKAYLRGSSSTVTQIAFTQADGNLVSASEDGTVRIWDINNKSILRTITLQGFAQLNSFAYNPSSGLLAAGGCENFDFSGRCTKGLIRFTTLDGENPPFVDIAAHTDAITSIAFNANGTQLVSGGADGVVFVWIVPDLKATQTEFKPLYTFAGHEGPVYSVAFNPRGSLLASAGADGKVFIRSIANQKIIPTTIPKILVPIDSLAFTQNNAYLIIGREDGAVLVIDTNTGELISTVTQHVSAVLSIAIAGNGKNIATSSKDGSVILWTLDALLRGQDTFAQSPGILLSGHTSSTHAVAFSSDSQWIASGGRDKTIIIWSVSEPLPLVVTSHNESSSILSMTFSSTGDTLTLAEQNGLLMNLNFLSAISGDSSDWTMASPARSISSDLKNLFFDPKTTLLAVRPATPTSNRKVLGIDVSEANGIVDWQQVKLEGYAFACAKATDGASTEDTAFQENWQGIGENGLLRCAYHVYRLNDSPEEQARLFLNTVKLESNDLPPVLEVLELGSTSSTSVLRDIQTWLKTVADATGKTPILRTSPNLWSKIIDLDASTAVAQEPPPQFGSYPLWVVDYKESSPDIPSGWANWDFWQYTDKGRSGGTTLPFSISRFNGSPKALTDFSTGQVVSTVSGTLDTLTMVIALTDAPIGPGFPVENATSAALSADGSKLALGLNNGTISIYDAQTAARLYQDFSFGTTAVTSIAFSPTGKELAAGFDDGHVIYIDLTQDPPSYVVLSGHIGKVFSLAFSPLDTPYGRLLASSGSDGNIFLWDLSVMRPAGQPLRTPQNTAITALAFHPQKLLLAAGTVSGQVLLWNVDPTSWKVLACDLVGRNLTEEEWQHYFPGQPYRITCPAFPGVAAQASTP